jgi:predicted nucleotidyltransferase
MMQLLKRNKGDLLRIFYAHPERAFYMHELGRMVGKKPGLFQRTLNTLVAEGVLASNYQARERYFRLNKEYPLYNELRGIVEKTIGITETLKKILSTIPRIDIAFVYGSYARGAQNAASDVDVFIVGEPDTDSLLSAMEKLESSIQREVNYKVFSWEELGSGYRAHNAFILSIMADKKIMLKGDEDALPTICQRKSGKAR